MSRTMPMTNDEIILLYRDARDKPEQRNILAQLNACSVAEIDQILLDYGCVIERKKPGRPPKISDEALAALVEVGKTAAEIARQVGARPKSIGTRIKKAAAQQPREKKKVSTKAIKEMNAEGLSDSEIARRLDVGQRTVWAVRTKMGLPTNRKSAHGTVKTYVDESQKKMAKKEPYDPRMRIIKNIITEARKVNADINVTIGIRFNDAVTGEVQQIAKGGY
jgi:DNA-binding CsgD family transcriptional regulator